MSEIGWIGVDLDGTLAVWGQEETPGNGFIGPPVPSMLKRVQEWLAQGREVRIVTARANYPHHILNIKAWLVKHGLGDLKVTSQKDWDMEVLYDDRAVQVEENTGRLIGDPSCVKVKS